ncbi:glycosyltransferase family 1 protein [Pseudoclavibacter terrae]|uniref:Glycosyltransferase family 1 protein n=1 Tax=Pseudoclavibacter terrae TaxID=1530195 RepID=A0A7J5B4M1_9MICO|nr:glycosyltransferase family 1 protein [Pseudoclavibacter terrae]KAB1639119.1 glycosyltransferase family 1 protein [Pseudoclavibacter terrae]
MTRPETALLAFPMHGQHKLSTEGYRTRDGHFIEWFGKKLASQGEVAVFSRPEPLPLELKYRLGDQTVAENTRSYRSTSFRLPNMQDRRKWWVDSLGSYRKPGAAAGTPVVFWNPFVTISNIAPEIRNLGGPVAFDLLDDWTYHYAFQSISEYVKKAYAASFEIADIVTANSEATLELARQYGRTDAVLVTNGCDPERFSHESKASGRPKVGYVGKIGKRVDLELVTSTALSMPNVDFVFAGPILDAEYREPLRRVPNIELLGDVHYEKVPELLTSFDIGWVPHRVGEGEVGGDVIKTYEYRAAGLKVLTTPVLGASDRGLTSVESLPAANHAAWLKQEFDRAPRVVRDLTPVPVEHTWEQKADFILNALTEAKDPR